MGRPPTKPKKLRDGFYIEVHPKGSHAGIKLRTDILEEMQESALQYGKSTEVTVLGEYKDGKPVKSKADKKEKTI